MKKIPVYKLRINEDDTDKSQVEYIALVDEPAVMSNWIAFNKVQRFASDLERNLIMGVAMIANMPIFRRDEKMGEHYVVFDKEEIMKVVQKFFRKGYQGNFNLSHDPNQKKSGLYIIESFIIDESRGVAPPAPFAGISDGSWIITVKVDNPEVMQNFIKTGEVKGFSIEGIFGYEDFGESDEKALEEIIEIVQSSINILDTNN